jgi:hypothetical protein
MQERVNATRPPCRVAMNSVDIAEFIANDDAEYMGDAKAVVLNLGTAVMLCAVEHKSSNRRAHGSSPQGRNTNRDRVMKEAGNLLDRQYFSETATLCPSSRTPSLSDGSECRAAPMKRYDQPSLSRTRTFSSKGRMRLAIRGYPRTRR